MNNIDFSNLGGFPLEQDTLDFMQLCYKGALGAVAKLCGDKTILYGVENIGGNVSAGWISYNGELLLFQGGAVGANVVISETPTSVTFEDGNVKETYFVRTATCGAVGAFPFSDLVPLLSLQNIWRPGDIKEKYCDDAYIAANFDTDGYGVNAEKGWRIFSKVVPESAGKVFVNLDKSDSNFYQVGITGGEKMHKLTVSEMPSHNHPVNPPNSQGDSGEGKTVSGNEPSQLLTQYNTGNAGGDQPHNNLQPFFVILKLIKL